jgi:hypothetical protein
MQDVANPCALEPLDVICRILYEQKDEHLRRRWQSCQKALLQERSLVQQLDLKEAEASTPEIAETSQKNASKASKKMRVCPL